MKTRSLLCPMLLACSIATLSFLTTAGALAQDKQAKVSDAEAKAAKAIEAGADAKAKMASAEAFIKKYPKSTLRLQVANYISDLVYGEKDNTQKLALAQKALAIFSAEAEVSSFKPAMIDAYIKLDRIDEAFTEGASFLAKNPENIQILTNLAIVGTEEAKKGKPQHVPQASQYGLKAIELMEADRKPADMDLELWGKYKAMLPQVYQEMGVISMMQQKPAEALAKVEKAAKLEPADPMNFVILSSIANDEYLSVAENFKNMPEGKAKRDLLARANELMDKVIDYYAHALALSEGKSQYQRLHDQTLQDVTPYYKYRHGGTTDGLQKLIDGYKLP